jgi:hypothetical protein
MPEPSAGTTLSSPSRVVEGPWADRTDHEVEGRWFYATDHELLYRYDGDQWDAQSGPGNTSQQLPGTVHRESVSTESVDVTQQQIQVVGANGSLYETIEPSSTTTPIQDGLGIGTNNSEEVVVLLPPTEVDEAGTITFDRYSKGVIGHGHGFRNAAGADNPPVGPSIINFTNDVNGFEFSGSSAQGDWPSGFRIEGFAMMGVNPDGSRPSGTAFLFDDADQMKPHSFYIGDIAGYYWHKIIRWTGGNAPWQCEFGPLFFDNVDAGNPSIG